MARKSLPAARSVGPMPALRFSLGEQAGAHSLTRKRFDSRSQSDFLKPRNRFYFLGSEGKIVAADAEIT